MNLENDYLDLIKYAKILCINKNTIQPEDLVNDAFIELHNTPYDKQVFKNKIKSLFFKESVYDKSDTFITRDTTRVCSKCNEEKPISLFRAKFERSNVMIGKAGIQMKNVVDTVCYECQSKISLANYHINIKIPEKKERIRKVVKKAFKKFVDNNRDDWNIYLRERYQKEKKDLTDAYIRKSLRNKYTTEELNQIPQIIIDYRNKLIEKRNKKLAKVT